MSGPSESAECGVRVDTESALGGIRPAYSLSQVSSYAGGRRPDSFEGASGGMNGSGPAS